MTRERKNGTCQFFSFLSWKISAILRRYYTFARDDRLRKPFSTARIYNIPVDRCRYLAWFLSICGCALFVACWRKSERFITEKVDVRLFSCVFFFFLYRCALLRKFWEIGITTNVIISRLRISPATTIRDERCMDPYFGCREKRDDRFYYCDRGKIDCENARCECVIRVISS